MLVLFTLIGALILGCVVALVLHLFWFIGWLIGKCSHYTLPYAPFGWSALGLAIVVWAIMAWGFFVGRFRLETTKHTYAHTDIPACFDGYRIVHISDLHLSTFNDRPEALRRIVDSINAQHPDLICFTGDLVTEGISEAEPFVEILKQLHSTDGVVSVLGNHDFLIYNHRLKTEAEREREVERLTVFERDALGWQLLRNQRLTIQRDSSRIHIMGVDNVSRGKEGFATIDKGELALAVGNSDGFCVLLTHDPAHWREEVLPTTEIQLTLSGHTHAGQVRLFGHPASAVSFSESEGWFRSGTRSLYINRGLGCTLPVRINCPGEITVITLKAKK